MPIPKPRKNESRKDFTSRCMSDKIMKKEYPNRDQRYAVCNSQYDKKKGDSSMGFTHNSKTLENEPVWSVIDKAELPRAAFADAGEANQPETWRYAHHFIHGDSLYLHKEGLKRAWAAANKAGASVTVLNHLRRHRNAIGIGAIGGLTSDAWLIDSAWLKTIYDIAMRNGDVEALAAKKPKEVEGLQLRDNTAIIKIVGPIFRYANLFTEMSGATSVSTLAKDLDKAINNDSVERIILDIDSPGGQVSGTNAFATMVKEATAKKPVIAYISGTGASAAYWIASAADEIVADATSIVGSIGVVSTFKKTSNDDIEIVSSNAPNKRPNPESKEGQEEIRKTLDAIADVFVKTVAENRGVTEDHVNEKFGKGGVLVGEHALAVGMIDRIDTFENIIKGGQEMSITKDKLASEHPELLEEIKKEAIADLEAENMELKRNIFKADLETHVNADITDLLMGLYGSADNELIINIAEEFEKLNAVIDDLGKAKGSSDVPKEDSDDIDMSKVKEIAEKEGLSMHDALVEYEKRKGGK